MPVNRRRFRIEQAFVGDMPMPAAVDGEAGPMHHEIMNELRSIRAQMAAPGHGAAPGAAADAAVQQIAEVAGVARRPIAPRSSNAKSSRSSSI